MTDPPLVSVLITAHDDAERIGATIESALTQDHPPERLQLIVVDDGSRDLTGDIVEEYAASFPRRIRFVRTDHGGAAAAMSRALAEARGDVLALLPAGEVWPAGRIGAQLAALAARPEVGLVYSELVPGVGGESDPPRGRPLGRLLRADRIVESSIALRGELRGRIEPIPAEIARIGWWIAVRIAEVAEIDFVPTPRATSAEDDETAPPVVFDRLTTLREALDLQRWFLTRTAPDSPLVDELGPVWNAFTEHARQLLAAGEGNPFVELACVTDAERAAAREALADAEAAFAYGEARTATACAARAAGLDLWCEPARELLARTLSPRPRRIKSDPLAGARRFVTLAFAEELLAAPELLAAYGETFRGGDDATLAIDASTRTPAAAGEALGELVARLGLDVEGTAHLLAVLAPIDAAVQARLPERVDALLTRVGRGADGDDAGTRTTPCFDERSIGALRSLALRAPAA